MNKRFSKTFVIFVALASMSFYTGVTAFASEEDDNYGERAVIDTGYFVAGDKLQETITEAVTARYNLQTSSYNNTAVASGLLYDAFGDEIIEDEEIPAEDTPEEKDDGHITDFSNIGIAITSTSVNVRSEASSSGTIVAKLFNGAFVTIVGEEGEWYKVNSGDINGFVKSDLLTTGSDAEAVYDKYVDVFATVNVPNLNVRKDKDINSEEIGKLTSGSVCSVIEKGDDWTKIAYDGKDGYVMSEYVDINVEYAQAIDANDKVALMKAQAKASAQSVATEAATTITYGEKTTLSDADFRIFVCLIYAESGGEPYEGKLGVANVVLNRLHSSRFPNTMEEVIWQKGQFGPTWNGAIEKQLALYDAGGYTKASYLEAIQAAKDALDGKNNIGTRMYFNGYKVEVNKGHTGTLKIGNHLFWEKM